MTAHTPGSWNHLYRIHGPHVITAPGKDVASVWQIADARLIAAAPDLLAALREVVACPQAAPWLARLEMNGTNVYAMARTAIAKAEGRT